MLKLGTQLVPATVMNIKYRIDVNTGAEVYSDFISKNEIARCELSVGSRIVFDLFSNSRDLGSMIRMAWYFGTSKVILWIVATS